MEEVTGALSGSSGRSLTHQVPANLLQGVPLRCLLAGAGRPFGTAETVTKHLRPCSRYDAFVSHDWETSRWLKYAALLVVFNSRAAAFATLAVSITAGLLIGYGILPFYSWTLSIGYLTFLVFFLFWQNIRDTLFPPKLAFLDKLVIPQNDEELKEQCILGLAAFLEHSQKLVILFSDAYIGRLWCIYEFSVFMRTRSSHKHVQTVPVVLPLLLLLHAAWWFAQKVLVFLIHQSAQASELMKVGLSTAGTCIMFFVTYPLQYRVGRQLTKNLQSLAKQLRQFDIQESKCTCCSRGHVKETGERIACDRELIYQSLQEWYAKNADIVTEDLHAGLQSFNKTVRTEFADQILSTWGRQSVPLDLFAYMVCSMNTPFLIKILPEAIALAREEPSASLACIVAMRHLIQAWGWVFTGMLVSLWSCRTMWSLTLQYKRWPILIEISSMAFSFPSGFLGVMQTYVILSTPKDSWIPGLMAFIFGMALSFFLLHVFPLPMGGAVETETKSKDSTMTVRDDLSSFSI